MTLISVIGLGLAGGVQYEQRRTTTSDHIAGLRKTDVGPRVGGLDFGSDYRFGYLSHAVDEALGTRDIVDFVEAIAYRLG